MNPPKVMHKSQSLRRISSFLTLKKKDFQMPPEVFSETERTTYPSVPSSSSNTPTGTVRARSVSHSAEVPESPQLQIKKWHRQTQRIASTSKILAPLSGSDYLNGSSVDIDEDAIATLQKQIGKEKSALHTNAPIMKENNDNDNDNNNNNGTSKEKVKKSGSLWNIGTIRSLLSGRKKDKRSQTLPPVIPNNNIPSSQTVRNRSPSFFQRMTVKAVKSEGDIAKTIEQRFPTVRSTDELYKDLVSSNKKKRKSIIIDQFKDINDPNAQNSNAPNPEIYKFNTADTRNTSSKNDEQDCQLKTDVDNGVKGLSIADEEDYRLRLALQAFQSSDMNYMEALDVLCYSPVHSPFQSPMHSPAKKSKWATYSSPRAVNTMTVPESESMPNNSKNHETTSTTTVTTATTTAPTKTKKTKSSSGGGTFRRVHVTEYCNDGDVIMADT